MRQQRSYSAIRRLFMTILTQQASQIAVPRPDLKHIIVYGRGDRTLGLFHTTPRLELGKRAANCGVNRPGA